MGLCFFLSISIVSADEANGILKCELRARPQIQEIFQNPKHPITQVHIEKTFRNWLRSFIFLSPLHFHFLPSPRAKYYIISDLNAALPDELKDRELLIYFFQRARSPTKAGEVPKVLLRPEYETSERWWQSTGPRWNGTFDQLGVPNVHSTGRWRRSSFSVPGQYMEQPDRQLIFWDYAGVPYTLYWTTETFVTQGKIQSMKEQPASGRGGMLRVEDFFGKLDSHEPRRDTDVVVVRPL